MKILALEREPSSPEPEPDRSVLEAEARCVWELQQSGIIREIYFNSGQHSAVLVLESISVEEARRELSALPLVRSGSIEFEIIPLAPYDGFARLFDKPA